MLQKYPDIAQDASRFAQSSVTSYVLDCEVVAWNAGEQRMLPFQILATRKRKVSAVVISCGVF